MNQLKRLGITLGILVGGLLIFILYLSWPLLTGTTIVLQTEPLDPFDPLRGQYMTIGYEITRLPSVEGATEGDAIYVTLIPDTEGIWRSQEVGTKKPTQGVFIRGKAIFVYSSEMTVEYGIEQFFFERHADLPTTEITIEAKVSSDGQARIVQMLHKGEPVEIKYKKPSLTS